MLNILYILYINFLTDESFATISSHSIDFLSLLIVSFAGQELLGLIQFHLPSFTLVVCALGSCLNQCPEVFRCVFFQWFLVSGLTLGPFGVELWVW